MYKVFDLIGVMAEEKEAMEMALDKANIPYYETQKADWGRGQPAIWVRSESQAQAALKVIAAAQAKWTAQAKYKSHNKVSLQFWKRPAFWLVALAVLLNLIWAFFNPGVR
jgi:hypothetical protein